MNRSEEIKQLAVALAQAQAIMKTAKKDNENPFFKSTYADLASVWDAIRSPFTTNGFSISQFTETKEDRVCVTTLLLHMSGEWLSSELTLPTLKLDPQAFGSALTYARRYALAAICGVASEEDDAEATMDRSGKTTKAPTQHSLPSPHEEARMPEKKKGLPTQTHKDVWKMLLDVYDKDMERIKLAIEEITQKKSLFACSVEEAETIINRLRGITEANTETEGEDFP